MTDPRTAARGTSLHAALLGFASAALADAFPGPSEASSARVETQLLPLLDLTAEEATASRPPAA